MYDVHPNQFVDRFVSDPSSVTLFSVVINPFEAPSIQQRSSNRYIARM
jgi:hypothetical protein